MNIMKNLLLWPEFQKESNNKKMSTYTLTPMGVN